MKAIARWYKIVFVLAALLVIGRGVQFALAAPPAEEDVDALIANAESAGTTAIAKDATILGWDDDGMPSVVLREGTNGWLCTADWPAPPGNDPMCMDEIWQVWNDALMAGEEPDITGPGVAYMLAGGSDPSNTDPFALEPAEGDDWISTPSHIMLLKPGGFKSYQFSVLPSQRDPYIMWDDTPHDHLMVPVLPIDEVIKIPTLAEVPVECQATQYLELLLHPYLADQTRPGYTDIHFNRGRTYPCKSPISHRQKPVCPS